MEDQRSAAPAAEPETTALEVHPEPGLPAPKEHLLAGYDRIREKVIHAVERRGGHLGGDLVKVLLLVPDIFLLLVRLVLDKEVPAPTRALIGSVIAYFLLPVDLLPEALIGGAGFLDDVVLAAAVLAQAFGGELEPYARKHWSGPDDLREALRDVTAAAHRVLGKNAEEKLKKFLTERGWKI